MNRAAALLRYLAAALLLIGGLVHLKLYFDGYRDFPDENLGRSFLLNVVASVVVAIAVAVRRDMWVRIAGIVVAGGTLVAFAVSRTDRGIFGLKEDGLEPLAGGAHRPDRRGRRHRGAGGAARDRSPPGRRG